QAVAEIAPEGREDPVVVPGVVPPELTAVPGGGHRPPPPTRAREEQLRELRTAADQPGELVGVHEMIHQAPDAQRRVAELVVPEPGIPLGARAPLGRLREPTRAGKYPGDIPALQLREARDRADERTGESYEGERRILVVEDVLEPLPRIRARRDGRVKKRKRRGVAGARDDGV